MFYYLHPNLYLVCEMKKILVYHLSAIEKQLPNLCH